MNLKNCPYCSTEGVLIMSNGRCPNCKEVLVEVDKNSPESTEDGSYEASNSGDEQSTGTANDSSHRDSTEPGTTKTLWEQKPATVPGAGKNSPHNSTQGILPMSDERSSHCKAPLVEDQELNRQSTSELEMPRELNGSDYLESKSSIQHPTTTEALSEATSQPLPYNCPDCGAGRIIPDKDGKRMNCNAELTDRDKHVLREKPERPKKLFISIFVVIVVLALTIYGVFYWAPGGETVFQRRDFNRYKKIVHREEFEKLQAYVVCYSRRDGIQRKLKVEKLGVDTVGVCLAAHKHGILTAEWLDEGIERSRSDETTRRFFADGMEGILRYIEDEMSVEMVVEYELKWAGFRVKRKWYHYLLL